MVYDVLTVGSATVDIFLKSAQFKPTSEASGVMLCERYNEKIDVEEAEMHSGGGATNVAVGLSRLGYRVGCVSKTGRDPSRDFILVELHAEKVETSYIATDSHVATGISVLLISSDGARTALVHRGAAQNLTVEDIPWSTLRTNWVHISSVGNAELLAAWWRYARRAQVKVSWNPGQWELKEVLAGRVRPDWEAIQVLFVNREEMAQLSGLQLQSDVVWHGNWSFVGPQEVVVTDGKRGGLCLVRGREKYWFEALSVPVVQETGAGDAFAAGYLAAHLSRMSVPKCLELGRRNAASVVQQMGAKTGLLHLPEA